jgi:HEAT repeat protein
MTAAPTYDEKLIAALRHERPDVAAMSAEVLGVRHAAAAVDELIDALALWSDADEVAVSVIEALAELGDPRALDALVAALRDRSLRQRVAAARALGRFDQPTARAALRRAAREDPNAAVRTAAAFAVGGGSS